MGTSILPFSRPFLARSPLHACMHSCHTVRIMMYGFGDSANPLDETVDLVEVRGELRWLPCYGHPLWGRLPH
jgi:hypothetical protein